MAFSIMTLNIEGKRHIERVTEALLRLAPDIVCLQEIFEEDYVMLTERLRYTGTYVNSAIKVDDSAALQPKNWGLAILSRSPIRYCRAFCYSEDPVIRTLVAPNDPRRFLIIGEFQSGNEQLTVATTHFTWSPLGQTTPLQMADFARLKSVLAPHSEYVLCGDLNSPRGRDMFNTFVNELSLVDNVPLSITSTIDGQYHRAGALNLVVDAFFSTNGLRVDDVSALSGLSDHKALFGRIATWSERSG